MQKVTIKEFPDYSITSCGKVYKGNKQISTYPVDRGNGKLYIRVNFCIGGGKAIRRNVATLIATHFIDNPKKHRNLIFKDRNPLNVNVNNLMWLDNNNYRTYCGLHKFTTTINGNRLDAANRQNKCLDLRNYYITLDEKYLHKSRLKIEDELFKNFEHKLPEMEKYFYDRAKRFSIYGCPKGLVIMYSKGIKNKIQYNENLLFHNK